MAKNPDDRYSTADKLASNLEHTSQGFQPFISPAIQSMAVLDRTKVITRTNLGGGSLQDQENAPRKFSLSLYIGAILFAAIFCVLITGGLFWMTRSGINPLSFVSSRATMPVPTSTNLVFSALNQTKPVTIVQKSATQTILKLTSIPTVSNTPEPSQTMPNLAIVSVPVIGNADKIAFLSENDIWIANLNGTGLLRLTEDGLIKSNLQWTPDGQSINF